jgi:hypothetical protein
MDTIESINAVCTDFYSPLLEEMFLSSIKDNPIPLNILNSGVYGDYFQQEFKSNIYFKLEKMLDFTSKNKPNKIVIWTDVDLAFIKPVSFILNDLLEHIKENDMAISPEISNGTKFNTGFIAMRCSLENFHFIKSVLEKIKKENKTEQWVMNDMACQSQLKIKVLPINYWNITVGKPTNPYLIHINYIENPQERKNIIEQKLYVWQHIKARFIKM